MCLNYHFILSFWLCATVTSFASCVEVKFYKNNDYTGLVYESRTIEKCHNLPENFPVTSFTTDTCLVQHKHPDCKSTNTWKQKPGNYSTTAGYYFVISSFYMCGGENGGSQLNLDITKYYEKDEPANVPDVLERYTRVCECINIPDYVQTLDEWSINNHDNEFIAYYEPDCSEDIINGTRFMAGHNYYVRNIFNLTKMDEMTEIEYKIQSFGPDKNSTYYKLSCHQVTSLDKKVQMNEQNLRLAEVRINESQIYMQNVQVELARKIDALNVKVNGVERSLEENFERSMEDRFTHLKIELENLLSKQNK